MLIIVAYAISLLPIFPLLWLLYAAMRRLDLRFRNPIFSIMFGLLVVPMPGPWGVLVPFGYTLVLSIVFLEVPEAVAQIARHPVWFGVALSATVAVGYRLSRFLFVSGTARKGTSVLAS